MRISDWSSDVCSSDLPLLLAGALLRLLTIQQAVLLAGRRFGVKAHIIPMPQPEACIDVDKPEDKDLVESILATGRSEISGSFGACRCAAQPISKHPARAITTLHAAAPSSPHRGSKLLKNHTRNN